MAMFEQVAQKGAEFVGGPDRGEAFPDWVPSAARDYLAHTEGGRAIRALARDSRVHPSTILRRVRRMESLRDDPLVDSVLRRLSDGAPLPVAPDAVSFGPAPVPGRRAAPASTPGTDPAATPEPVPAGTALAAPAPAALSKVGERLLAREAMPVLRRLAEAGSVLAVARDMDKGIIVREVPGVEPTRLAVVSRRLAEAMALRDWIACPDPGSRVRRYRITTPGRAMLRRLLDGRRQGGLAEGPAAFLGAVASEEVVEDARLRHMRSALAESPLCALARRRDEDGRPFLPRGLVAAGERLREDFEIAQELRPSLEDWDALLERLPDLQALPPATQAPGPEAARARIERALADLGPGLADVALRACCLLEGLEQVEKRLGWSARSGKVVLRIALERLGQHYRLDVPTIG
ncbi:DUF6456 domain-containing protein [Rubellimicrobium aerolatum]|uniref:DUF6456 domain-containing protein n=1 Tax=Rubellimicrobium aerolatum TaxID=490979 RepID=A0ABW0S885_9RHOB|nr:DUF6456 domain-containing protein [Rubellimicrobium aerolatum]MBP1804329.1 hypothetical protein [Rubellimicrobium aerolatum]